MTIKIYGVSFKYLYKLDINIDIDIYIDTNEYHPNLNKKIYISYTFCSYNPKKKYIYYGLQTLHTNIKQYDCFQH